eukprot:gb/GEZN01007483.1/.p1 GENE.gb/GEZN01007483.1/~~gb/GEZN01007483.1/.p1  ORF type:complete len:417 (-),score=33.83 gb/GEZN01007483.1/:179-1429(-)
MSELDYIALDGPVEPAMIRTVKHVTALIGFSLLGAVVWVVKRKSAQPNFVSSFGGSKDSHQGFGLHMSSKSSEDINSKHSEWEGFFNPSLGLEHVMAKPAPPTALQLLPSQPAEPSCLFCYGPMGVRLQGSKDLVTGAHRLLEGWVYGARIYAYESHKDPQLATITGVSGDIIKGRLLCWPVNSIREKLSIADRLHDDPIVSVQGLPTRGVVSVVRKDGSSVQSFWYYNEPVVGRTNLTSEKLHLCTECADQFADSEALAEHERTHNETDKLSHLAEPEKVKDIENRKKDLKCVTCGKLVQQATLKCEECENTHMTAKEQQRPNRARVRDGEFECPTCGKGFPTTSRLATHKRTHLIENPYKCKECAQPFHTSVELRRHSRIHQKEKLYECRDCNRRFSQLSALKAHIRMHGNTHP